MTKCSEAHCERTASLKGKCRPCYERLRRVAKAQESDGIHHCTVAGCDRVPQRGAGGLCAAHYKRLRVRGTLGSEPIRVRVPRPDVCATPGCGRPVKEEGVGPRGGDRRRNRGAHGLCINCTKRYYAERDRPRVVGVEYLFEGVPA